jgi:hypothetical protein
MTSNFNTAPEPCFWCGSPSTHRCRACGHMICDSLDCARLSAIDAGKRGVRAIHGAITQGVKALLPR